MPISIRFPDSLPVSGFAPLDYETHEALISLATHTKCEMILRMDDFYKDAFFEVDALPKLEAELISMRRKLGAIMQPKLDQIIEIVALARKHGHPLEALAD